MRTDVMYNRLHCALICVKVVIDVMKFLVCSSCFEEALKYGVKYGVKLLLLLNCTELLSFLVVCLSQPPHATYVLVYVMSLFLLIAILISSVLAAGILDDIIDFHQG